MRTSEITDTFYKYYEWKMPSQPPHIARLHADLHLLQLQLQALANTFPPTQKKTFELNNLNTMLNQYKKFRREMGKFL